MPSPRCPDCKVAMKGGWIPDATQGMGIVPSVFVEGKAKAQFSMFNYPFGAQVKGGRAMPLEAFRCPDCGLVRIYAFPKKWNKVE